MGLQSTLPHKSTHATGGSDPITPAQIGAATAAQGVKADTASQPGHEHVIDDVSGLQAILDDFQTALGDKQVAGSYATLVGGLVPSVQLPSYVDDVLEYADVASLPATGEAGKIYVTLDTGKCFRWSGSGFIEISPSPGSTDSVAEGVSNLYFTDARAQAANQAALDAKAAATHTHDDRYYTEAEAETLFAGNSTKQLSGQQYFDPQGGWVQVAAFPTAGMRHMVEFGAFISDDLLNRHSTIKLLFILDGYDASGYSESYFPVSQISKHVGEMFVAARVRLNASSFPGTVYLDVKLSSSGVSAQFPNGNVRIVSWAKVYHRDAVYSQCIPNLSVVPAPDTTGHVLGPEFYPRTGILEKLTSGDYSGGREGAVVANRVDATVKIFHKGVWNQISPQVTSYSQLSDKPALGTAAATDSMDYAAAVHAASHAADGSDPITPASIGAQPAGSYATLDSNQKLTSSQIPEIAISDFLGACANQAAMLKKSGQKGDWVTRSDDSKVYVITGDSPSQASSWTALSYPAAPTLSTLGAVAISGDTMTGKLTLPASTTTSAKLNLGIGSIPTTPALGDVWLTASTLSARVGEYTTLSFAAINAANTFTKNQTINGRVGIGVSPDASVCLSVDSTGIKFSNGSTQTTAAVTSITGTAPIASSGGSTPAISIAAASTTASGAVQLEDSTTSTSTTKAATPNSVKSAYDLANGKVSKAGDTITGNLDINPGALQVGDFSPENDASKIQINSGNIELFNGAEISWSGIGVDTSKNNLRNSISAAGISVANTFTQPQIVSTDSAFAAALRITQVGAGEALRVEDSANPDTTPFVVSATGRVGIGVSPDCTVALKVDSTGIKFSDNTVQTTVGESRTSFIDLPATNVDFAIASGRNQSVQLDSYNLTQNRYAVLPRSNEGAQRGDKIRITHRSQFHIGGPWDVVVRQYEVVAPLGVPQYGAGFQDLITLKSGESVELIASGQSPVTWSLVNPGKHTHSVSDVTGLQTALDGKQVAGSYATLVNGLVPAAQLPSYVDDVLEFPNSASFPGTGEAGKIYLALDTGKVYRYGSSTYVEVSPSSVPVPVFQIFDHLVAGTTNLVNLSSIVLGGGSMSSSTRMHNSIGVATLTTSSTLSAAFSAVGINPTAGIGNNTAKSVDLALGDRHVFSSRGAFFALPSASTTGLWYSGFLDNLAGTPANGCYFRIVNGGNLTCVCANDGSEAFFNYGSVPTAGMHLYEVVVRGFGTAVDFYYDGALIATITDYIPKGAARRVNYGVGVAKTATAAAGEIALDLDLVFLRLGSYSDFTLNI